MLIRCYGARGSIPVSGPEYVKYGGDTTCLEIRAASGETIIVDAGSGIRRLGNSLIRDGRFEYHLFFTHSHWDHILGFPFFRPVYMDRTRIRLHGCTTAQGNVRTLLAGAMAAPYFPVPFGAVAARVEYDEACSDVVRIGSVEVRTIPLSHPNLGQGYRFMESGRSFVFLTDNELGLTHRGGRSFDEYRAFAEGADILVHDAEYRPEEYEQTRGWGHSTFTEALRLALEAGVGAFGLFHHNQNRSDAALDSMVQECRQTVAAAGRSMDCYALTQDWETLLE